MIELPRCDTNTDVLDLVKQSGRDYEVIAKTIYGLEIVCVRTGGEKKPPIVITAGAHAGEPAGVLAALALINTLKTEHAVYVIPLRDPFAWGGFARCLGFALGEEVVTENHNDVESLLAERGRVVYREEEDSLIISWIGDLVFVSMRPLPDTRGLLDIRRRLRRVMRDNPELVSVLAGKRSCWPSNLTGIEGCGDFDRAFSAFVTSQGEIVDLNRQFTFAYPPIEVASVRDLVDRIKPGLILDLHEAQGSKFFMYVNCYEAGVNKERDIATAILEAVVERGGELYSLKELTRRWDDPELTKGLEEPVRGVMVGALDSVAGGASFLSYCQRYGASFTLETGRWTSLAERVEWHLTGSLGAISEFERQYET